MGVPARSVPSLQRPSIGPWSNTSGAAPDNILSRRAHMGDKRKKADESESPPGLKRKAYEKELRRLQAELCHLQAWVKHKGLRAIVIFEGRDGAGKGGTIRAI